VSTCQRWEAELGLPIHRLDGTPKARVFAHRDELDSWLAEKPFLAGAPDETVESTKRKKLRWLVIAAGALVVLAVLAAIIWRVFPGAPVPIPASRLSLAILDFENPGGDETLEAWTTSLPDLLVADLTQSKFVTPFKYSREANLKKLAEEGFFDYAASGSLTKAGGNIDVTILVHKLKGEGTNKPIQVICRDENDLMARADEMTRDIKLSMALSARQVSSDTDEDAIEITTSSPQAFKL
jgi:TolB-like protein